MLSKQKNAEELYIFIQSETRVLWNTYPVRCCCMKLCETQLIAEEDYKFARTHTFVLHY